MRTTKLLPIVASIIASGLLVLATTTSNAAIAQTGAQSIIAQLNKQLGACISGTTTTGSCTQTTTNTNTGNAVSVGSPGSSTGSAIGQSNTQGAFVLSGGATTDSGTQTALNNNTGNAVSGGF